MDDLQAVYVTRTKQGDSGTFGQAELPNGVILATGELPWHNNQNGISCIPDNSEDGYLAKWLWSESHKAFKYHLVNVPGRTAVEIHSGNFCGDVSKGYQSDVLGCILLGKGLGQLMTTKLEKNKIQDAVVHSADIVKMFEDLMDGKDFILKIKYL